MENPLLKNTSLFSDIDANLLKQFSDVAIIHKYKKGQTIYCEGDSAQFFFIIKSGWVKIFHQTLGGEEAVTDILTTSHIFGENAVFENFIYSHSAEAVEDCEILALPLSLLQTAINNNHKIAVNMLGAMSYHRKKQEKEIEHLTIQTAPQRIGCFLLRLIPKGKTKNIVINLPYDKTLIASRLGMKPETLSRAIKSLTEKTGIKITGARVDIASIESLSEFSCSACSSSYPCEDIT